MSNYRVYIMMIFTALFWSGAFVTGKIATKEFPAFALTCFRFLFALPLIFAILKIRQPQDFWPSRKQWLPLMILGILGTFLYHALFFSSLTYTTAINSSLIGSTNPIITALLAAAFFHERLSWTHVVGVGLSFVGVLLTITNGNWHIFANMSVNVGDIFMFAAVWSWAGYAVLSRKFMQKYNLSPLMLTAYTFLVCTVFSIPFVLWENPASYLSKVTMHGWLAVLYMAIFASVLGYLFQLIAIQHIGASKTAIFINLVPVFTMVEASIILGETLTAVKVISAVIIIAGVYLTTRPQTLTAVAAEG